MLALSKQVIKVHEFRKLMMVEKILVVVSCYPGFQRRTVSKPDTENHFNRRGAPKNLLFSD